MAKKQTKIHLCKHCDAELPKKRIFCNDRCEELNLAASKGTAKYRNNFVSPTFQKMVRAESAAEPSGTVMAVSNGIVRPVHRMVGEVVCVTCGSVGPWIGGAGRKQMQGGHFCSRKDQSVLYHELNVAVQCSGCNQPPGSPNEFRQWMTAVRGTSTIEMLEKLARESFAFSRDELVDKRLEYLLRINAAIARMKRNQ